MGAGAAKHRTTDVKAFDDRNTTKVESSDYNLTYEEIQRAFKNPGNGASKSANATGTLLSMLRSNVLSVRLSALSIVSKASEVADFARNLVLIDILSPLLSLVSSRNKEERLLVLDALRKIAAYDELSARLCGSLAPKLTRQLFPLDDASSDEQRAVLLLLLNLSVAEENRGRLIDDGILPPLVKELGQEGTEQQERRLLSLRVIANLVNSEAAFDEQLAKQLTDSLVVLLRHPNQNLQRAAIASMANMAKHKLHWRRIIDSGALPPILDILRSPDVSDNALRTGLLVVSFLAESADVHAGIMKAGVECIVDLTKTASTEVRRVAHGILATLASAPKHQLILEQVGARVLHVSPEDLAAARAALEPVACAVRGPLSSPGRGSLESERMHVEDLERGAAAQNDRSGPKISSFTGQDQLPRTQIRDGYGGPSNAGGRASVTVTSSTLTNGKRGMFDERFVKSSPNVATGTVNWGQEAPEEADWPSGQSYPRSISVPLEASAQHSQGNDDFKDMVITDASKRRETLNGLLKHGAADSDSDSESDPGVAGPGPRPVRATKGGAPGDEFAQPAIRMGPGYGYGSRRPAPHGLADGHVLLLANPRRHQGPAQAVPQKVQGQGRKSTELSQEEVGAGTSHPAPRGGAGSAIDPLEHVPLSKGTKDRERDRDRDRDRDRERERDMKARAATGDPFGPREKDRDRGKASGHDGRQQGLDRGGHKSHQRRGNSGLR